MSHFLLILILFAASPFLASADDHIDLPIVPQSTELDFSSLNALSESEKISAIENFVKETVAKYDFFIITPHEVIEEREGKEYVTDITLSLRTTNFILYQCNPNFGSYHVENYSLGKDTTKTHSSHLISLKKDSFGTCLGVQFLFKTDGRQRDTLPKFLHIDRNAIYKNGFLDLDFKTRFQGFKYKSKINIRPLNEDDLDQLRGSLIELGKALLAEKVRETDIGLE